MLYIIKRNTIFFDASFVHKRCKKRRTKKAHECACADDVDRVVREMRAW